jgi:hypothetical protein
MGWSAICTGTPSVDDNANWLFSYSIRPLVRHVTRRFTSAAEFMRSSAGLPGFADKAARERLPLKARSIMASAKRSQTIRLKRAEWTPLEANGFKRPVCWTLDRPPTIPARTETRPTFRCRLCGLEPLTGFNPESGTANAVVANDSDLRPIEFPRGNLRGSVVFACRSDLSRTSMLVRPSATPPKPNPSRDTIFQLNLTGSSMLN